MKTLLIFLVLASTAAAGDFTFESRRSISWQETAFFYNGTTIYGGNYGWPRYQLYTPPPVYRYRPLHWDMSGYYVGPGYFVPSW